MSRKVVPNSLYKLVHIMDSVFVCFIFPLYVWRLPFWSGHFLLKQTLDTYAAACKESSNLIMVLFLFIVCVCVCVLHTNSVTSVANVGLSHSPSTLTSFAKNIGLLLTSGRVVFSDFSSATFELADFCC